VHKKVSVSFRQWLKLCGIDAEQSVIFRHNVDHDDDDGTHTHLHTQQYL